MRTTYGRPVRRWCRYGRNCSPTASAPTPTSTSTPAPERAAMPPPATSGSGSATPTTTRLIPAPTSAVVHGPVRPSWQQGSSVVKSVAPLACSPASANATTSAWAPPGGLVAPTPTTRPSATTTAPTQGLGELRYRAAPATSMACAMKVASVSTVDSAGKGVRIGVVDQKPHRMGNNVDHGLQALDAANGGTGGVHDERCADGAGDAP